MRPCGSLSLTLPWLAALAISCASVEPSGAGSGDTAASDDGQTDRDPGGSDAGTDDTAGPDLPGGGDGADNPDSPQVDDGGGSDASDAGPGGDADAAAPDLDASSDPTDGASDSSSDWDGSTGGPACTSNRDCSGAANTCALFQASSTSLGEECRAPVGGSGPGSVCTTDGQCASGHCLFDHACLAPCVDNSDCPGGTQTCGPLAFTVDDGGTPFDPSDDTVDTRNVCLPDLGTLAPCATIGDCPVETETCGLLFDSWRGAELRCEPQAGGETDGSCATDGQCQTGICLDDGHCYWPCGDDSDCGSQNDCGSLTFVGTPQGDLTVPACLATCKSSDDCMAGEGCEVFLDDAPANRIVQLCATSSGTAASGATCTNDSECRADDCFDFGGSAGKRCAGPCDAATQTGCAANTVCYVNSIYVQLDSGTPDNLSDDTFDAYSTCLPDFGSFTTCTHDADCQPGETCSISFFNNDLTAITPRCVDAVGAGGAGATCAADSDCKSDWCLSGDNVCAGACTVTGDCVNPTGCISAAFILDERDPATPDDDLVAATKICD